MPSVFRRYSALPSTLPLPAIFPPQWRTHARDLQSRRLFDPMVRVASPKEGHPSTPYVPCFPTSLSLLTRLCVCHRTVFPLAAWLRHRVAAFVPPVSLPSPPCCSFLSSPALPFLRQNPHHTPTRATRVTLDRVELWLVPKRTKGDPKGTTQPLSPPPSRLEPGLSSSLPRLCLVSLHQPGRRPPRLPLLASHHAYWSETL
jgi:hypothetical protein